MNGFVVRFREYWERRHLIPKGVWLLMITYSLVAFGLPMPPRVTWLEIVMGSGLLLASFALFGLVIREARQHRSAKWCLGLIALLCLLPLCVGLMRGNALTNITRDFFPLLFLLVVPILLTFSASSTNRAAIRTLMVTTVVFVGICYAVTFWISVVKMWGSLSQLASLNQESYAGYAGMEAARKGQVFNESGGTWAIRGDVFAMLVMKMYDPAVLFVSIFLGGWGVVLMSKSWRGWLPGMILAGIGGFIAYELMTIGLRSYFALIVSAVFVIFLSQLRERGFYIRLLPIYILACALFWPKLYLGLQVLSTKQHLLGANGKADEWRAVFETVFSSAQSTLFGIGWGGGLMNPYLNADTLYTHSILSFYLLKTGVIGLGILIAFVGLLIARTIEKGDMEPLSVARLILLVSCVPPLLIGVLFEPTYKMLSYGMVLALFALALPSFKKKDL